MAHPARTFQELRRQRQSEAFVGRADEAFSFEENLRMPLDDPRRKFLVAISGQGGMGKTTFMDRCREIAEAAGAATAWSDEAEGTVVDVMAQLATDLNASGHFDPLLDEIKSYRARRLELEGRADAPPDFARLAADIIGRGGTKLARRIPVAGAALEFVDEDAVGSQLSEVVTYVLQNVKKQEDARLVLQPLQVLTPLFLDCLVARMAQQSIALFFDTFEETRHSVEPWLLSLLNGDFGDFPLNLLVVMAGRYPPNPQTWTPFESLMQSFELQPLAETEMRSFLNRKSIEPDAIDEIIKVSQGIPILLASLAIGNPEDPQASDTLVERILRAAPASLRSAAIKASLPRVINRDVGCLLMGENSVDTSLDWLIDTPFVNEANSGWKYHDVIRHEFVRYAKRRSPDEWKESQELLGAYYDERRRSAAAADLALEYNAEFVYHNTCLGERSVIEDAVTRCLALWRSSVHFGRPVAIALRDGEDDSETTAGPDWGRQMLTALDELDEGRDAAFLAFLDRVVDDPVFVGQGHRDALAVRSDMYRQQGRLDIALADIDKAIAQDETDSGLMYDRAWIHMQSQQPESAFIDCEGALFLIEKSDRRYEMYEVMRVRLLRDLIAPEDVLAQCDEVILNTDHPWAFMIRGQIHRSLRDTERAVSDFRRSMDLQPSWRHQAWKAIAIAHIEEKEFELAETALDESLKAAPECGHCWELLGAVYAESKELEECKAALTKVSEEIEGEDLRPYRALGYLQSGLTDLACKELRQAVADEPARADLRLWLAEASESAERWDLVEMEADQALLLRPDWPPAMVLKARCRFHNDDHKVAEGWWSAVQAADPREMRIGDRASRGLGLSILGRYADALEMFERVLDESDAVEIEYNRAVATAKDPGFEGDWKREVKAVMTNLEARDESVVRSYGIGGLQAVLGNDEQALKYLEEAVKIDESIAVGWARFDPAWISVRETAGFERMVGAV